MLFSFDNLEEVLDLLDKINFQDLDDRCAEIFEY